MDIVAFQEFKVVTSRITQGVLLGCADGFDGTAEISTGAGADFDEDEDVAMAADQIEFAPGGAIVTCKYTVTVLS